ncbi:N-acetylmuramoyl-L-alanine amidase [Sulfurimonas sp.]|uniref:N-acetylmuramoyl-L-alanine amidase family protein n=1 Tax=Sulfurimonas sp. TaxID=2022749 RepID=UPI0025F528AB|nr:N-acetylmuramoyl-L-alanine amidase [Sulfurimonas sp.]MDD5156619.1 N-acetylmuramoyl-L-alanine amidase [Sulfurimonas sp.]
MIRLLSIFFIFYIALYALSDEASLKKADRLLRSTSKSDQFRAYDSYKDMYLRAVMSGDSKLESSSLKGIVKSGTLLDIDVSQYSDELKNKTPKQVNFKQSKEIATAAFDETKTKKQDDIWNRSLNSLVGTEWVESKLILTFDRELKENEVHYFTLHNPKKNLYKYVFDISSSALIKSQIIKKNGIDKIKFAQNGSDSIRIVIENSTKIEIEHSLESEKLIINLQANSVEEARNASLPPKRTDRTKTIMIDAGHGGTDPGAIGYNKYREKDVVFSIAQELNKILKSRGYTVYMTRDSDVFVKLSGRTRLANDKGADLFISVHANAVGKESSESVNGIECFFLSPSRSDRAKRIASKENSADISDMNMYAKDSILSLVNHHNILASNKLAIDLQRGMLGALKSKYDGVVDGGVREGPFWVLVGASMPSVLIEVGFITNPTEATRLVDLKYQQTMAKGMADGVERYFANN